MTNGPADDSTTRVTRLVKAGRGDVYAAFLDPGLLAAWLPPGGMRGVVPTEDTDTFQGRFVELVPRERIGWAVEFESDRPAMSGEMRVTWILTDAEGGTHVAEAALDTRMRRTLRSGQARSNCP